MAFNLHLPLSLLVILMLSTLLTWVVRHVAMRKAILDIPNERSSHKIPTPRGGGLAIVCTFIPALLILHWTLGLDAHLVWALATGGVVIAALGYCDDIYTVKTRTRIFIHFLVALWALYWLGGYAGLNVWLGSALAWIGIVWCLNFYNFMDGIDGLAGCEGIVVATVSGIALWWVGATPIAWMLWCLASTIGGFTLWNWPPAKIFMGDVGSGFLGYTFAVIALYTVNHALLPLAFWWIMLAVFIWDATFTVIHRGLQGKKWYSAHKEHAYQVLIAHGATHRQVTLGITFINCAILAPLAFYVLTRPSASLWLIGITALGLWFSWYHIRKRAAHV